jgi:hypothetical protein
VDIRSNAVIRVSTAVDGSKRVKIRKPARRRTTDLESLKVQADVLAQAMRLAGGDPNRIEPVVESAVDGVVMEVRVINRPRGEG